jgi:hypothetical protein
VAADYREVYSLEEDNFEWLDMAEEFFKHDGRVFSYGQKRNNNVGRAGERYNDIEEEYRQLERMHEVAPDHVVEPLMPIYQEGEMVGFYMENFDGDILKDYLLDLQSERDIMEGLEVVDEVESVIEELHEEDVVHGDLTNNILYDGETFKFFDPVGVPKSEEAFREMKEWDESTPSRLRDSAKHPFQDYID